MINNFGKTSKLMIKARFNNEKTVLEDVAFTAPFKIMKPFYENQDLMTIMCLTASAGIMEGDEQEFEIFVKEGAKLEFVSQSYEKIHKMNNGSANRTAELYIGKEAYLYYDPLPTLPFKDSAFTSKLKVHLEDDTSQFILKEVLSAGRCARGELFQYRYYHNHIQIEESGKLIYVDNTKLHPTCMSLNSLGMYEEYTHFGTLLLCHFPKDSKWFQAVRTLLDATDNLEGGVTQVNTAIIAIRVLGYQADKIEDILNKLLII